MLPYLDQRPLSESLIRLEESQAADGFGLEQLNVPLLLCPNETLARTDLGQTSYFFNDGTVFRKHSELNGFRINGNRDTRPGDVGDGLSHTASMSERLLGHVLSDWPTEDVMTNEPRRYFWFTETRRNRRGEELQAVEQCRNHRTTVTPQFYGMNTNLFRHTWGYDHLLPPNHAACYNGPEDMELDNEAMLIPASSLHPGGVNVLMGDGSVHFVSQRVDAKVWQAAGTRSGQESTGLPFGA
jgi:prepilin-type processing-associated H-X9-DG protein